MKKTVEIGSSRTVHGNMMITRQLVRQRILTITVVAAVGNIIIRSQIKDQTGTENHLRKTWISVLVTSWREGLAKE